MNVCSSDLDLTQDQFALSKHQYGTISFPPIFVWPFGQLQEQIRRLVVQPLLFELRHKSNTARNIGCLLPPPPRRRRSVDRHLNLLSAPTPFADFGNRLRTTLAHVLLPLQVVSRTNEIYFSVVRWLGVTMHTLLVPILWSRLKCARVQAFSANRIRQCW